MNQNNGTVALPPTTDELDDLCNLAEATSEPAADARTQIESSIQTFDSVFASDPLRDQYREVAADALAQFDAPNTAFDRVSIGSKINNLQLAEMKLRPAAYKRADVLQKVQNAFHLFGVPSTVKVQDIVRVFWVARLDQSIPGENGQRRKFTGEATNPDWFGGNLSYDALLKLGTLIKRVSKKDELDAWEYNENMEAFSRDLVTGLRDGTTSKRAITKLAEYEAARIAAEKDQLQRNTMTAAQIAARDEMRVNQKKQADLAKLNRMIADAQKHAVETCDMDKDLLGAHLVNTNVITPVVTPAQKMSIEAMAAALTPGDAKDLVQRLADRGRKDVLKAMVSTLRDAFQAENRKQEAA